MLAACLLSTAVSVSAAQAYGSETPEEECDVVIGVGEDGLSFAPYKVEVAVGDTVCWQWTDESMAHNVVQVEGEKSEEYTVGGVNSGEAVTTIDYRYTFTEDMDFYYVCEPHMAMDMYGHVVVGEGSPIVEPAESKETPGFLGVTAALALLGAVALHKKNE